MSPLCFHTMKRIYTSFLIFFHLIQDSQVHRHHPTFEHLCLNVFIHLLLSVVLPPLKMHFVWTCSRPRTPRRRWSLRHSRKRQLRARKAKRARPRARRQPRRPTSRRATSRKPKSRPRAWSRPPRRRTRCRTGTSPRRDPRSGGSPSGASSRAWWVVGAPPLSGLLGPGFGSRLQRRPAGWPPGGRTFARQTLSACWGPGAESPARAGAWDAGAGRKTGAPFRAVGSSASCAGCAEYWSAPTGAGKLLQLFSEDMLDPCL